jgi:hypothetical protein
MIIQVSLASAGAGAAAGPGSAEEGGFEECAFMVYPV